MDKRTLGGIVIGVIAVLSCNLGPQANAQTCATCSVTGPIKVDGPVAVGGAVTVSGQVALTGPVLTAESAQSQWRADTVEIDYPASGTNYSRVRLSDGPLVVTFLQDVDDYNGVTLNFYTVLKGGSCDTATRRMVAAIQSVDGAQYPAKRSFGGRLFVKDTETLCAESIGALSNPTVSWSGYVPY